MSERRAQLREQVVGKSTFLVDGAMGTELVRMGVPAGAEASVTHPEAVESVHRSYVEAGSQAIITNTLTANRIYMETHGSSAALDRVNRAAVAAALRAVDGVPVFVFGDVGPTGGMLAPYGTYSVEAIEANYEEQINLLVEAGVDGLYVETMFDLQEALCATRTARRVASGLPLVVSLSFSTVANGGRTMMGNGATESAVACTEAGADAFGLNCGDLAPAEFATIVAAIKDAGDIRVAVEPNAGKPRLDGETTVYDMPADTFADGIKACLEAGADIIGGCCGTGPDHISALATILQQRS